MREETKNCSRQNTRRGKNRRSSVDLHGWSTTGVLHPISRFARGFQGLYKAVKDAEVNENIQKQRSSSFEKHDNTTKTTDTRDPQRSTSHNNNNNKGTTGAAGLSGPNPPPHAGGLVSMPGFPPTLQHPSYKHLHEERGLHSTPSTALIQRRSSCLWQNRPCHKKNKHELQTQ